MCALKKQLCQKVDSKRVHPLFGSIWPSLLLDFFFCTKPLHFWSVVQQKSIKLTQVGVGAFLAQNCLVFFDPTIVAGAAWVGKKDPNVNTKESPGFSNLHDPHTTFPPLLAVEDKNPEQKKKRKKKKKTSIILQVGLRRPLLPARSHYITSCLSFLINSQNPSAYFNCFLIIMKRIWIHQSRLIDRIKLSFIIAW